MGCLLSSSVGEASVSVNGAREVASFHFVSTSTGRCLLDRGGHPLLRFLGDLTSCSTAPDQAVSQHEEYFGVLFQRYLAQRPYSTLTNDSTAMIGSRVVGSISYYLPRSLHRVSARYVGFAAYRNFKLDARFFVWIAEYPTAYFMVARSSSALSPQP